ncbi:MAG TPA: S-layer homology domain-containing protein, partial [bacterium]|nr:S-layer homology domain-containing protein [bacterium]
MNGKPHRLVAILIVLALVLPAIPAAATATVPDIESHWAQPDIETLIDLGAVTGLPDGSFRPELTVTRAEFVTMVNKSVGIVPLVGSNRFKDVKPADWFAGQVEAAAENGYVTGNPDGTFSPYRPITREQAAAMLIRVFGFARLTTEAEQDTVLAPFTDADIVSPWARAEMATAVSLGLVGGYTATTLAPQPAQLSEAGWQQWEGARTTEQREAVLKKLGSHGLITRAQTAAIIVRALALEPEIEDTVFAQAGIYGPEEGVQTITGNAVVTAAGVTLQNLIITGNLTIAEQVDDGTVVLENVTVNGDVHVKGGGKDSVIFRDCLIQGTVLVEKENGQIRIVAAGSTAVPNIILQSGAVLVTHDDGSYDQVILPTDLAEETEIVLIGDFNQVEIAAAKAKVQVGANSTIADLILTKDATGTAVNLDKDAAVEAAVIDAKVEITGEGSIDKAEINATGVVLEMKPDKLDLKPGVTADIAGEKVTEREPSGRDREPTPDRDKVSAISITTVPAPDVDGKYANDATVTVTLDTTTSGATIYYTLDGTTPTSGSTKYTEPFTVEAPGDEGGPVIVKAIGMRSGYTNSAVATKTITFKAKEVDKTALVAAINAANTNKGTAVVSS